MTVAEVAEILKLNQQTVRNWIDAGLPASRAHRPARPDQALRLRRRRGGAYSGSASAMAIWEGEVPPPEMPADS